MNIKGINQNVNPEAIPEEYLYWAKNGINSSKFDACVNENGNKIDINLSSLDIQFKNGICILGNKIIIFYKDNSNYDCISVIDEITKLSTLKVRRTDLNFQIDKPIKAKAKLNSKNELIIAFVDGYNTDKYINLDTALSIDSLNFYNLFPIINNASNITTALLDSGSVTTGAYFITFQYIAKDRTRSSWTTISNPTYITIVNTSDLFVNSKGINTGKTSNKSIKVTLSNIDISQYKVAVAIISKINGVISSKLIKEVFIANNSNLSFIYNGTEDLGTINLDEIITTNPIYNSSNRITVINDQLFLADLTVDPTENFQIIANQTVIRWKSTIDRTTPLTNLSKYNDGNKKTFIHDEVVPFYIQFELVKGGFTQWYHIPGRVAFSGDTNDSGLAMGGLQINGRNPKKYEVEDTCIFDNTESSSIKSGLMGFWQNDNEVYPSDFLGVDINNIPYAGQKVRHHKFPSIGFLYENVWTETISGNRTYGINVIDLLDIEVQNVVFDTNKIKGYRIGYAQKNTSDINVLGIGLTKFSGGVSTNLRNTGGNFSQLCFDSGLPGVFVNPQYLRFNSFDIWQDRPALNGVYLRNYIKLRANKLTNGEPNYPTDSSYGLISSGKDFDDDVNLVAYISNFTRIDDGTSKFVVSSAVTSNDKVRKLSEQNYIPNNTKYQLSSTTIDNRGSEETIHAKIEGANLALDVLSGFLATKTDAQAACNFSAYGGYQLSEEVYLSSLKNAKSDFFIDFTNQIIVTNPQIIRDKNLNSISNIGDGFIGVYSYITLAGYGSVNYLDFAKSVVMFNVHIGVGRHNVNQRYETIGDFSTYFYPDSGLFTLFGTQQVKEYWFSPSKYQRSNIFNNFQYSKDFSALNIYNVYTVFNSANINQNDYHFRILRSLRANRDNTLEDGWKTFKPLDYFDTVRDKGRIINLEAWGTDALIIHHERALFRTRDKAILQTNIINITLGSGDIFAIEPREEGFTTTGTGGTQHQYGCILTEIGYLFIDEEAKEVYQYDGNQLKDFSGSLKKFFQTYLDCKIDNPYNDNGICWAFDNKDNRIILSQKADINFTLSYDLIKQEWAYAHDFIPDFIFNTRSKVYSFKNNDLYTHSIGDKGKFYGIIYPFYIDVVINQSPSQEKVLEFIEWISKYKISNTSVNPRKTITAITIWTDLGCTGKIDIITNETSSLFIDSNTKVKDEKWSFNNINNNVTDITIPFIDSLLNDSRPIISNISNPVWYDTERLRGNYFIIRLEYNNIENKEVYLREVMAIIRKSNN